MIHKDYHSPCPPPSPGRARISKCHGKKRETTKSETTKKEITRKETTKFRTCLPLILLPKSLSPPPTLPTSLPQPNNMDPLRPPHLCWHPNRPSLLALLSLPSLKLSRTPLGTTPFLLLAPPRRLPLITPLLTVTNLTTPKNTPAVPTLSTPHVLNHTTPVFLTTLSTTTLARLSLFTNTSALNPPPTFLLRTRAQSTTILTTALPLPATPLTNLPPLTITTTRKSLRTSCVQNSLEPLRRTCDEAQRCTGQCRVTARCAGAIPTTML